MDHPTDRDWERLLNRLQEFVGTARVLLQQGDRANAALTLGELEQEIQNQLRDLHQTHLADEGEQQDEPSQEPDDEISPLGLADA